VVVPTTCGLDLPLLDALSAVAAEGARVTYAPSPPRRDGTCRPLSPKLVRALPSSSVLVGDDATDVAAIRKHAERALEGVPRVVVSPSPCAATVHRDAEGAPRVVFLVNPTRDRQRLTTSIAGVSRLKDLLDGSTHDLDHGVIVDAMTVRFCEVVAP
jgi:hypothetical protein